MFTYVYIYMIVFTLESNGMIQSVDDERMLMRWDGLFADLEAQSSALEAAERAGEVEERVRFETGRLRLLDRLRSAVGCAVGLDCAADLRLAGTLARVGSEWLLLEPGSGGETLVALDAVHTVTGLPWHSATPESQDIVESRLGLRAAIRGLARDRSVVRIQLRRGLPLDGTIERVGADFFEVSTRPAGEHRRPADSKMTVVALGALVAVGRRF